MSPYDPADEEIGSLRPPRVVTASEAAYPPASLFQANSLGVSWLKSFHDLSSLQPFRYALRSFVFIWIVNEANELWIAIEEVAPEEGSNEDFETDPRRGFPFRADLLPRGPKLGHPSLVDGAQVRAAGELALQLSETGDRLVWTLNGNSGRYSHVDHPSSEQLENVANLLRKHHMEVEIEQ